MRSRNPVLLREHLPGEMRRRSDRVVGDWRRFRDTQRFLEDHFPDKWENIRRCGLRFKSFESRQRPGHYKLVSYSCHEDPYCLTCTRYEAARRVKKTLDNFNRCTPKGKPPRFIHIVQTAPIYGDWQGWGVTASRQPAEFARVVWDALTDHFGAGIGAVMSYQDFGERCFAKRHPHQDLTLNGWMLQDGKPEPTPRIELAGGGRAAWDATVQGHATRFHVDAERGSANFSHIITGHRAYYPVLKYQMRELVDLRKLTYNRAEQRVGWMSYKDNTQQGFTVQEFLDGLREYQARLGVWVRGAPSLHRAFGHISKRSISKTEEVMDGAPIPHGRGCPCGECEDWDRVFLDEVESARGVVPHD